MSAFGINTKSDHRLIICATEPCNSSQNDLWPPALLCDVQMQCLLFVTRHGPRQPLSCVTKVKKYELKNDTESLEERVSCGCFHREDLLWFQSHPVCTRSTEHFGNSLRFFIVNDMSVWLFIKLYFHTLWRIRSANRKSSADFLMLFRWRSFLFFFCLFQRIFVL